MQTGGVKDVKRQNLLVFFGDFQAGIGLFGLDWGYFLCESGNFHGNLNEVSYVFRARCTELFFLSPLIIFTCSLKVFPIL